MKACAVNPTGSTPTISNAMELAKAHRQVGVLILSFANGKYSIASYGWTRRHATSSRRPGRGFAKRRS